MFICCTLAYLILPYLSLPFLTLCVLPVHSLIVCLTLPFLFCLHARCPCGLKTSLPHFRPAAPHRIPLHDITIHDMYMCVYDDLLHLHITATLSSIN